MDDNLHHFADAIDPATPERLTNNGLREPEDYFERIVWRGDTKLSSTDGAPAVARPPSKLGFGDLSVAGDEWRTFVLERSGMVILLAQRASAREEFAQHAAVEISAIIVATMMSAWLSVRWTVRRYTRRLGLIGAAIADRGIDAKDPLPVGEVPAEYRPVVDAMNVLNEKLHSALQQQRRFIADSAHE